MLAIRRFHAALVWSWLILLGGEVAGQTSFDEQLSKDCGVTSLYTLLKLNSVDVDLTRLRTILPSPGAEGLSMAQLQAAGRTLGITLHGRQLDPTTFPLDRAQIARLRLGEKQGHFIVIQPVGSLGQSVMVLDFPRPPRVMSYADLTRMTGWTGLVLTPVTPWERFGPWGGLVVGLMLIAAGLVASIRRWESIRP